MRTTVLWCAVVEADGGGGVRWLEPTMEAACMHICVGPTLRTRADGNAPSSDPMNCISLFN
jgi:hypothetical protein